MLTIIEKVILLQNVDLFTEVRTDELVALAAITEEVEYLDGDEIYLRYDAPDAMYLVLQGSVRLHQDDRTIAVAQALTPFGSWALFDEEPRVTSATAAEAARLLRIDRDDFTDLLSDQVQIAQAIIKSIAHRLRALAELGQEG